MLILTIMISVLGGNLVMAQDEITDVDLRKYAIMYQSIELMKRLKRKLTL